ncbi:hypothetical protein [Flavobacterium sp.]|uniref:hypothetical protein n=1 Tax=Flavobacterium sp. TaxID=239 RepID=UPI0012133AE2|nr:hypothetical protein [Flavobacterium sp.]RZJ72824.1 MAG: hypothetical protein EOO49_04100 [Flavobacterium sp.]
MEDNKNDMRHREDARDRRPENENEEPYIGADKDVSGNDITVEGREERRFHQNHGNRKYESNSNHSSADDQPTTNTGPGNF